MSIFPITWFSWSLLLATVVSSFSLWRNLKEDYTEEEIFKLTLLVLMAVLFFSWFLSVSGAFLGLVFAVVLRISKMKKSFWDVLDAFALPMIYFFLIGGIGQLLTTRNFLDLFYPGAGSVGFLLFPTIKKRYRTFLWYKSGKTGFLFWTTSFYFFLFLLGLAFFGRTVLYWEEFSWGLILIICLGAIYWRSERKRIDFKWPK